MKCNFTEITGKKPDDRRAGSPATIARMYDLHPGTLANLRHRREGPRFFKVGRRVLYFISDVEEWLKREPILTKFSM